MPRTPALKNNKFWVAWFLAEQCKAEKGVCEKRSGNQLRTAFVRGVCLAPRACFGRGAQLIAGDSRKSNGLRCVRPSTLRRAVSKWPLEKHTRQWGCIACVHSHYAVREVKWPLQMHTRQWAAACMRPFTVRRAGSKMASRDAHTPMGSACIRPWTCTRMRRHRCRNPYLFA